MRKALRVLLISYILLSATIILIGATTTDIVRNLTEPIYPGLDVYFPIKYVKDFVRPLLPELNVYYPIENVSRQINPITPNLTVYFPVEHVDGLSEPLSPELSTYYPIGFIGEFIQSLDPRLSVYFPRREVDTLREPILLEISLSRIVRPQGVNASEAVNPILNQLYGVFPVEDVTIEAEMPSEVYVNPDGNTTANITVSVLNKTTASILEDFTGWARVLVDGIPYTDIYIYEGIGSGEVTLHSLGSYNVTVTLLGGAGGWGKGEGTIIGQEGAWSIGDIPSYVVLSGARINTSATVAPRPTAIAVTGFDYEWLNTTHIKILKLEGGVVDAVEGRPVGNGSIIISILKGGEIWENITTLGVDENGNFSWSGVIDPTGEVKLRLYYISNNTVYASSDLVLYLSPPPATVGGLILSQFSPENGVMYVLIVLAAVLMIVIIIRRMKHYNTV